MGQVIDLDEIQREIEAQQGKSVQPSPSRAPKGLDRALTETVWQLMGSMFGHKWVSSYGAAVDPDRVWSATLYGLGEIDIRRGMRACVDLGLEWPPSAPEFRDLCLNPNGSNEAQRVMERHNRELEARRALPPPPVKDDIANATLRQMREMLGMAQREETV